MSTYIFIIFFINAFFYLFDLRWFKTQLLILILIILNGCGAFRQIAFRQVAFRQFF
ncbi:hypothetical protein H8356DRAFT_1714462 [Neocallimastix lanati (nom. inval.)]|nr:hypothetical protein H8356DRAFT_1714462 [Neocallimastix sp. JGI-2020a]